MNNEHENRTARTGSEGSNTRPNADDSLRILISCADALPDSSSCSDEQEWINLQSESVVHWAERERWLLDLDRFKLLTAGLKKLAGGLEHQVFLHPNFGRVVKLTKPPYFGAQMELKRYAYNAIWANLLFGDDIRLEGFLQVEEGVSVAISQPFVFGKSPTESQIKKWFEDQGYVVSGWNKWRGRDGSVIADAHTGNFIRTNDGTLIPIDLQVLNPGSMINGSQLTNGVLTV